MRKSGVLLPISSLPSQYGIGTFSKESYEFVDFLEKAGQKLWQILPLGPTGYGDSPYQSFSTFAGNPYYIDLEELIKEGLLTKKECNDCQFVGHPEYVDYERIYQGRFSLLKKAYERSNIATNLEFQRFVEENAFWLEDYSLYMAIKDSLDGINWIEWEESLRLRDPETITEYREKLWPEIECYQFQQYYFAKQWKKLKAYANEKGIEIVGDIPIYVALDSADAWANPDLFQLEETGEPKAVAGCPPDAFSATGQLWGNPLYRWDYHKKTGYDWWMRRIGYCYQLYDVLRIDHFRGFDEYYAIPYGDKTAEHGHWEKGPGMDLFRVMKERLGEKAVIAEDLGFLTESVLQLVKETGFPGMKVLQFAYDSGAGNAYLPHNYKRNCVVYTGTHDNDTMQHWYESTNKTAHKYSKEYLAISEDGKAYEAFARAALSSIADICIIPIQDYMGLGGEARVNTPSTRGDNWKWRLKKGALTGKLANHMKELAVQYGRA
ncbi:MAG: 4-alpha-glucanotransferase [Lachnospiraceae bacterium]|nr:4-alpha-glucanotransferase [Lachnospiraceae bacterium]